MACVAMEIADVVLVKIHVKPLFAPISYSPSLTAPANKSRCGLSFP